MEKDAIAKRHRKAMDLVDAALLAERRGDEGEAVRLRLQAFEEERKAANGAFAEANWEPTRSVLHRSAATLALRCELWEEALRLVERAFSATPPQEIAAELRAIAEQARAHINDRAVAG